MVVSTREPEWLEERARARGVPFRRLGTVGGARLTLAGKGRTMVDLEVAEMLRAWMSLEALLEGRQ
jgi:hypothetical protein